MKRKRYGRRGKFFIFLMSFCLLISLADGIHHVVNAQSDADSTDVSLTESADVSADDSTGDVPNADDYDVVADDDGNVYINGMLVQDGDVLPDGSVVSIGDVNDEADTELSEDEPFTLSIPFVDTETAVTFLPTEEGVEIQQEMLYGQDSATRDTSNSTVLPEDGRVELSIQIAPGKKEQPEVPLRFGLEIRNGMYADLLVWDSESQQFSDALTVYDVVPEAEKSVALTLLLPPALIERLRGFIGDSQTFKIVSWMADAPDAKVQVSDLMVVNLPERFAETIDEDSEKRDSTRGSRWVKASSFCKNFSNSMFGATVYGSSDTTFDSGGGSAEVKTNVYADVDVCVLGKRFDFLDAFGSAKANATNHLPERDCQDSSVQYLKKTLWHYFGCKGDRNRPIFSVDVNAQMVVIIFIIPVELKAGAHGELGILVECNKKISYPASHISYKAGPYVDSSAYASAAVTCFVAWAGIKGTLNPIIKDEFWGELACSMEVRNGGRDVWGNISFRVGNELYGPRGHLEAYAGYRYPSICKKEICLKLGFFGKLFGKKKVCWEIPYPCIKSKEKPWTLADWNAFERHDILLDVNESVTVRLPVPVEEDTKCYFATKPFKEGDPEQCYGGIGSRCEGDAPWIGVGTEKNYDNCTVTAWVSIGSILHDECCLEHPNGYRCGGDNSQDGECRDAWDEAVANTTCNRHWQVTFGPYTLDDPAGKGSREEILAPPGQAIPYPPDGFTDTCSYCRSGQCQVGRDGEIVKKWDGCGWYSLCN